MSYSFTITADTKAEAKQKITDEFERIASTQDSHKADRDASVAIAHSFVDVLGEPEDGHEVYVYMYGSLGWKYDTAYDFTSAQASVQVLLRKKEG